MNRELVHTEERDGFTIKLYLEPEDMDPRDSFDEEIEKEYGTFGKIERGELLWFCAHVVAERDDIELGHDYLGGCCYASVNEFIAPGDYYTDMVNQAIAEARAQLERLCA